MIALEWRFGQLDGAKEALKQRFSVDPAGKIIVLQSGGVPWKSFLYYFENKHNLGPIVRFVLYPDTAGMWRVQAVTVEGSDFTNRLGLPQEWRGLRDEALFEVTKIPGIRFCHAAGFIGGSDTYDGVLAMARNALKDNDEK